jgi:hypothetical protein
VKVDGQASWGEGSCNVVCHIDNVSGVNHACYRFVVEACSFLVFIVVRDPNERFDEHSFKI